MKPHLPKNHPRFPSFWPRVFSPFRFLVSALLIIGGMGLLFFSIFLPVSDNWEKILFVLDTSLSMAVEDIVSSGNLMESRLDLAKSIITSIVDRWASSYGIITYARSATLRIPFSHDRELFLDTLTGVEPTLIYGGSDVRWALDLVRMAYLASRDPIHIVLITDGGMTGEGVFPELPSDTSLTVIGIGTPTGGMIPLGYNLDGEKRYKYYEWSPVVARYEKDHIDTLVSTYGADLIEREKSGDTVTIENHTSTSTEKKWLQIFSAFLIFLGYFIRPYAAKK